MIILDSSVWIALFSTDDSQHQKANILFQTLSPPFVVPEYIALEVTTILQNKKLKYLSDQFLKNLENKDMEIFLPSSPSLFQEAQKIFTEQEKNLSFVDCSLVALSSKYSVITFDEGLEKYLLKK